MKIQSKKMVWNTLLHSPANFYFRLGALNAAIAVGTGAFGGHGLKKFASSEQLDVWKTAVHYHFIHSLALIAVSQLRRRHHIPGGLFTAGILLFSGSLYALVLSDVKVGLEEFHIMLNYYLILINIYWST